MHQYLPSKKFIYAVSSILTATVLISTASWLADHRNSKDNQVLITEKQREQVKEMLTIDTDNDGLKDWEESLWKTDPKNTDTDKDGSTDGEEVSINRNPTKENTSPSSKEPNDFVDEKLISEQKKETEDFLSLSQTEQLSRLLFSQYLASKSGQTISATDKQIILDTALSSIEDITIQKYSLSDIKIIAGNSTSTIKDYGNKLGSAFLTGTTKTDKVENELNIIDRALTNEDEKVLNGLDPLIEGYGNTINKMKLIEVPSSASNLHLALMNNLATLKYSLESFKKMFSDPATGMVGLQHYQVATTNLILDIGKIKNFLIDNGVSFGQTDPGYFLLNII